MSSLPTPDPALETALGAPPPLRLQVSEPEGLSIAQVAELERARRLTRPLRRAGRVASFGGWSTILLGIAAAPFALADFQALALALAFIGLGYNELCARRSLFSFDPRAPRRLAMSQLMLMGVLIGYAALNIYDLMPIEVPRSKLDSLLSPSGQVDEGAIESLSSFVSFMMYAGLIVGTILIQGSTALFYAMKRRPLRRFLTTTPPWVVGTMRTLRAL